MNITKKKVVVVSLIISLLAVLSLGTLAWFNATYEVTNTFKVATSDDEGTPDFKVDVFETSGSIAQYPGAKPGTENDETGGFDYEDILPGDQLAKQIKIKNSGKYDQWVRVKITFDEYTNMKAACNRCGISENLTDWIDVQADWTAEDSETTVNGDTITYVYYYNNKLTEDQVVVLSNVVNIPPALEQQDMKYVSGDFTIKVTAEVIQAEHTGETAKEAFANCWN